MIKSEMEDFELVGILLVIEENQGFCFLLLETNMYSKFIFMGKSCLTLQDKTTFLHCSTKYIMKSLCYNQLEVILVSNDVMLLVAAKLNFIENKGVGEK